MDLESTLHGIGTQDFNPTRTKEAEKEPLTRIPQTEFGKLTTQEVRERLKAAHAIACLATSIGA